MKLLQKFTSNTEVTILRMVITNGTCIEIQEEVVIDANRIKRVYTAVPFKRDDIVYKQEKLTDEVKNNYYYYDDVSVY